MTLSIQELRVIILVDNSVQFRGLLGEAGFSALVTVTYADRSRFRLLFDTGGPTLALQHNLAELDEDLRTVDAIVLSHGHWDHVGGLIHVLGMSGMKPPVVCHPDALLPKVHVDDDGERTDVGSQGYFTRRELESMAHVVTTTRQYQVSDGIMTTGEVPRENEFETIEGRLTRIVKVSADGERPDTLADDLSVYFAMGDGRMVVLTGCCHAGIVNTLNHLERVSRSSEFSAVVGGLHLHDASKLRLERTVDYLRTCHLSVLAPCHCTGFRGRAVLMGSLGDCFRDVGTGSVIEFVSEAV
ncbi:MAG: MBL fold metallo-hydrolase [Candidatus Thorarchaeota archaeon]|nr:MBL fold metallo-hydrolase [Candidatus Thorarchaeota archaeon]